MSDGIAAARARAMAKITETKVELPIWQPWADHAIEPEMLPIEAPPCPKCAYWKPLRLYAQPFNTYAGVQCCHAETMQRDFSCFAPKREP